MKLKKHFLGRNMRTKINRLNEIDLNDTHFMNDIAIIVVNDIDEILEFKEKAPLILMSFAFRIENITTKSII